MKKGKPAGVQLFIRAVVRDPDGKIINDTGRKPARSFLIQFLEFVRGLGVGTGTINATATDGTEDVIWKAGVRSDIFYQIGAGINDSDFGIVIGTGDTAVTNTDHKLETQLTEGAGAGNITHGEMIIGTAAVVGTNVDMEIKRAFTNSTGSTITVKEAGLYAFTSPYYHCTIRDVLSPAVEVPDKCSLTVIYTVRTTV